MAIYAKVASIIALVIFIGIPMWLIISIFRKGVKVQNREYLGMEIVSFFIPIVGLIIYAVNIGQNQQLAKCALKSAIFGFIVGILLSLVIILVANPITIHI